MIVRTIRYARPSATVRTLFGDLLGVNDYHLLLSAANVAGVLVLLRTTAYAPALRLQGKSLAFALQQHWISRVEKVANLMPARARELCLAYLAKLEVEAVKTLLRGISRAVDRRRLVSMLGPLPATSSVPLDALLAAKTLREAAKTLSGTAYGEALAEGMEKTASTDAEQLVVSLLPFETALERQFFARLIAASRHFSGRERAVVGRLIGTLADATNVIAAERLKKTFYMTPEAARAYLVPVGSRLNALQRRALCEWTGEGTPPFWFGGLTGAGGLRVAALRMLWSEARKLLFAAPFQAGLALAYVLLTEFEVADLVAIYEGKQWGAERSSIADQLINFQSLAFTGASGV